MSPSSTSRLRSSTARKVPKDLLRPSVRRTATMSRSLARKRAVGREESALGNQGEVGVGLLFPDVEELEQAPFAPVGGMVLGPRSGDFLPALRGDGKAAALAFVPDLFFDLVALLFDVAARVAG